MSPAAGARRPENLALFFQEVLTAIERLRSNRQSVVDAQAFRQHNRDALRTAANQAAAAGYDPEDLKSATFAVVAFLDESVLNSQNPIFGDWLRKPLQEELFGTHVAGEVFYQNLQRLLARADSADLADVLEVYLLCLLLGFGGRYGGGHRGELKQVLDTTTEKIRRIRGRSGPLAPAAMLPEERIRAGSDPWVRRLGWAAGVAAILVVVLFIVFKLILGSGAGLS